MWSYVYPIAQEASRPRDFFAAHFWPLLIFFVSLPFSRDPLADVCWAIVELDAARFATLKKTDSVLIHQRQIFQVQGDAATDPFRTEQLFQLTYIFSIHSTAQFKDHLSIRYPRDLQHPLS